MARGGKRGGPHFDLIGRAKHSVPIKDDLWQSPACANLSPTARCVLVDFMRAFCGATGWEKHDLPDGMIFSPSRLTHAMSENTFRKAMRELEQQKFIKRPPEIQPLKPGEPIRWLMSGEWRTVAASTKTKQREASHNRRIQEKRARRRNFEDNKQKPPSKNGPTSKGTP